MYNPLQKKKKKGYVGKYKGIMTFSKNIILMPCLFLNICRTKIVDKNKIQKVNIVKVF